LNWWKARTARFWSPGSLLDQRQQKQKPQAKERRPQPRQTLESILQPRRLLTMARPIDRRFRLTT